MMISKCDFVISLFAFHSTRLEGTSKADAREENSGLAHVLSLADKANIVIILYR